MSIVIAGCSATRESGMPIEESGFLCDYSLLSETDSTIPGDFGPRPKLRYINPEADWAGHKKVLVDPVTFFSSKDVAPPREVQILLNYFYAKLRKNLKRDYKLVDSPQPETLRLTIALARAGEPESALDVDQVDGRVKASSLKKIGDIIEKHPEEAVSIIRSWIYQDQA